MAEQVPLHPSPAGDPEDISAEELLQVIQQNFPREFEIAHLRLITAKYRAMRHNVTSTPEEPGDDSE